MIKEMEASVGKAAERFARNMLVSMDLDNGLSYARYQSFNRINLTYPQLNC